MTRMTYFVPSSSSVRIERDSGVVTRRYLVQHFFASSTNSLAEWVWTLSMCFGIIFDTTRYNIFISKERNERTVRLRRRGISPS